CKWLLDNMSRRMQRSAASAVNPIRTSLASHCCCSGVSGTVKGSAPGSRPLMSVFKRILCGSGLSMAVAPFWKRRAAPAGCQDGRDPEGFLSTNKDHIQELRTPAALAFASGSGFARDHDHMIGLFIQRAGLGAGLGIHGFF